MTTTPSSEAPNDELLRRLRGFVRQRVPCEADVDDVLQDVLLRWHRQLLRDRPTRDLSGFLWRVTKSVLIDHHRSRQRHAAKIDAFAMEPAALHLDAFDDDSTEAEFALANCVRPLLRTLPPEQAQALEHTDLGTLTQTEAAHLLGLSVSGMKSRVQRGRKRLHANLLACCGRVDQAPRCGEDARCGCA